MDFAVAGGTGFAATAGLYALKKCMTRFIAFHLLRERVGKETGEPDFIISLPIANQ